MSVNSVPVPWVGIGFIIILISLSQVGLSLFLHIFKNENRRMTNEVTGIVFGAISLIYSLVLAFVIVAVWQDYDNLENTIRTEADKLNSILAHSTTLPEKVRKPLNLALTGYCNQVIEKEWKIDQQPDVDHPSAIPELRTMLLGAVQRNNRDVNIYTVLDNDLSAISDLRRSRLSHNHSQIPDLVWLIMESGSIMLIIFFYFFHLPSLRLHRIYLSFLSAYIGMCMFLVYSLDHPFDGLSGVKDTPYKRVLSELARIEEQTQTRVSNTAITCR